MEKFKKETQWSQHGELTKKIESAKTVNTSIINHSQSDTTSANLEEIPTAQELTTKSTFLPVKSMKIDFCFTKRF